MSEPIKKEIKEEILFRIKNEGLSVPDAAVHYGINRRTVYGWLSKAGINNPSTKKLRDLTNENDRLYAIIGRLSTELNRIKRGRSCK
jgi:transposase-like protein